MESLRVGAIGYGYWGPNLIRNFVELPTSEVVAVSDLDESRLLQLRERHPQITVTTTEYRDLFALNLDAVVVATPPDTHFEVVKACLQNDLHVLVEKPLTLDSAEGQELIRIADEHNRILMVGHTFEYNPAVRALKEMIDSGELGSIHYIDAVRVSLGLFSSRLNVVWDLAPHDISILLYLLSSMPTSICAQGNSCVQEGIEDVAYMTMRFPGDIMAHMRLSWLDPLKTRRITVVGSKKMVIYDDLEPQEKLKVYDKRVNAIRHTETYGEFGFAYHYGDVVAPYVRFSEPLRIECSHFIESILENKPPQSDGRSGLRVVQIIEAAQRSLQDGNSVIELVNPAHGSLQPMSAEASANGARVHG